MNLVATGTFLALFASIIVLAVATRRRPRLAQIAFLVIAAFVLSGKVYSPQYVLWLVPLAALARPRWRDFLIWQAGEVVYFAAIWWHLAGYDVDDAKTLGTGLYAVATFVHVAATVFFAVMVIRDMVHPEHDPVRGDGIAADADDPGGGPFDHAPDALTLAGVSRPNPEPRRTVKS